MNKAISAIIIAIILVLNLTPGAAALIHNDVNDSIVSNYDRNPEDGYVQQQEAALAVADYFSADQSRREIARSNAFLVLEYFFDEGRICDKEWVSAISDFREPMTCRL